MGDSVARLAPEQHALQGDHIPHHEDVLRVEGSKVLDQKVHRTTTRAPDARHGLQQAEADNAHAVDL